MRSAIDNFILLTALFSFLFPLSSSEAFQLPDTGIPKCYNDEQEIACPAPGEPFYGQDGQYFGHQRSYQDNGDGTITDLTTGLVWQQTDDGIDRGQDESIDYCSSLNLGSGSDWRLPNVRELLSIVDYSRYDPSINPIFSSSLYHFWSSQSQIQYDGVGHIVDFRNGEVACFMSDNNDCYTRCVSGDPYPESTYYDNGDGTVFDSSTGLTWQKNYSDIYSLSWQKALSYCEELSLAGYSDWRLPNILELESIVDRNRAEPALSPLFSIEGPQDRYLSSTTNPWRPYNAYYVHFRFGGVGVTNKGGSSIFDARCVREGPSKFSGFLAYFEFSIISSPQEIDTPFTVTIEAKDFYGNRVSTFSGAVRLTSSLGDVYPTSATLVDGQVTIPDVRVYSRGKMKLKCDANGGKYGESNCFTVGQGPCSASIEGFVVECTGSQINDGTVFILDDCDGHIEATAQTTSGKFTFLNVPCGVYNIQAEKDGKTSTLRPVGVNLNSSNPVGVIEVPLNCGNNQTPIVLVPGILGSSVFPLGIHPILTKATPADKKLYIHAEGWTGFSDLEKKLKPPEGNFTVVRCPWDWRQPMEDAVSKWLKPCIDEALLRSTSGKVHVVAHSMGGLLTRTLIQSRKDEFKGYAGKIDKFAMVGTPNLGACDPYFIWEGGDPLRVDNIKDKWWIPLYNVLNFYTNSLKNLWILYPFHSLRWPLIELAPKPEVRDFVRNEVPSLRQLMYTENFLSDKELEWSVTTLGNVNSWLKGLNSGNGDYDKPSDRMSADRELGKVEVRLFVGRSDDSTIGLIYTKDRGSLFFTNSLYEDGVPRTLFSETDMQDGDGTVPYVSAKYPADAGWASISSKESENEHSSLIKDKDFISKIISFLNEGSESTPTNSLDKAYVQEVDDIEPVEFFASIDRAMRLEVVAPDLKTTGIDPVTGFFSEEISESDCVFEGDFGGVSITNPSEGTYSITYFGEYERDFHLKIDWRSDTATERIDLRGFRPDTPAQFDLVIDLTEQPHITVLPNVMAPSDLTANPYDNGGTELTRLSWNAVSDAGVSGYKVYAVNILEPYFHYVATVSAGITSFDTDNVWAGETESPIMVYAVTAIKADGSESFFSKTAPNNDRDHDGVSDVDEASLGTNPQNPDSDGDGLSDGDERNNGTDPKLQDSDKDGYSDGDEVKGGGDPLGDDSFPIIYINPDGLCGGLQLCRATISSGIDFSGKSATIKVLEGQYGENLEFKLPKNWIIKAGYDEGFASQIGTSYCAKMVIHRGTIEVERLSLNGWK